MRQLYLAATGMNRGKTTVSLGLLAALFGRGLKTGFIKPVGQRSAMVDGVPADEDAILMKTTSVLARPVWRTSAPCAFHAASPRRSSTARSSEFMPARVSARRAERVAIGREVLLVEGTGHAGVRWVINSPTPRWPGCWGPRGHHDEADEDIRSMEYGPRPAPCTPSRGRGRGCHRRPDDRDAQASLAKVLEKGLARRGIELLGVLPYQPLL